VPSGVYLFVESLDLILGVRHLQICSLITILQKSGALKEEKAFAAGGHLPQ
jgi:hypothetical protein